MSWFYFLSISHLRTIHLQPHVCVVRTVLTENYAKTALAGVRFYIKYSHNVNLYKQSVFFKCNSFWKQLFIVKKNCSLQIRVHSILIACQGSFVSVRGQVGQAFVCKNQVSYQYDVYIYQCFKIDTTRGAK